MRNVRFRTAALLLTVVTSVAWLHPVTSLAVATAQENIGTLWDRCVAAYRSPDYAAAEAHCGTIIDLLSRVRVRDIDQQQKLIEAYELRARARFARDPQNENGPLEDFRVALQLDPSYQLGVTTAKTQSAILPTLEGLFNKAKAELIGRLRLTFSPPDADVFINNKRVFVSEEVPLVSGPYQIRITKPGHTDFNDDKVIIRAGQTTELKAPPLVPTSSTILIVTSPPGAEVTVDGKPYGPTQPGPPKPPHDDNPAIRALPGNKSDAMVVDEQGSGTRHIELRMACYEPIDEDLQIAADKHGTYTFAKELRLAQAKVNVDGRTGDLYRDGVRVGSLPLADAIDVCAGERLIEVRTEKGLWFARETFKSGGNVPFKPAFRPAVAILEAPAPSVPGDVRLMVEEKLAEITAAIIARPVARIQSERERLGLKAGWLTFDGRGLPIGVTAGLPERDRKRFVGDIAAAMQAQGVLEINVPNPNEPHNLLLLLFARGSSQPDTIPFNLYSETETAATVERLKKRSRLHESTVPVELADVTDLDGRVIPIVVEQFYQQKGDSGFLAKGDRIVRIDGKPVADSAEVRAAVRAATREFVEIAVVGPNRVEKNVTLRIERASQLIGRYDADTLSNKAIIDFEWLVDSTTGPDQMVASLNLAVAHMRVRNWAEARKILETVRLADTRGVSNGTVRYLIGECLENLSPNNLEPAREAYREAEKFQLARLTADGPLIKELASRKLTELKGR